MPHSSLSDTSKQLHEAAATPRGICTVTCAACMARNVVSFLAVASVLAFLATTTVVLRFWAHTKTGNRFGPDDVLIIPALVRPTIIALKGAVADTALAWCSRYGSDRGHW